MSVVQYKEIVELIESNNEPKKWVSKARIYSETLQALIDGKGFKKQLIQVDHVESDRKILSRQKYTFSTKDLSTRAKSNIKALWSAQGGSKIYAHLTDQRERDTLIEAITNIRGGQSLEQWNEAHWINIYHTDPSGVTVMEYDVEKKIKPYPVYHSINTIRDYESNGINVEWILFEPIEIKLENGDTIKKWRFIDDLFDWSIIEKTKEQDSHYQLDEDNTFENPFQQPPVLINSNIVDSSTGDRLSPFDPIIELLKEFLRDKSIKTQFKFLQGFPLFWRYVQYCSECTGTGVQLDDNNVEIKCSGCDGDKIVGRRDVTDVIELPIPTEDAPTLTTLGGWMNPDPEILNSFNEELKLLEETIIITLWGVLLEQGTQVTATEKIIDLDSIIKKLNEYSHAAEQMEKNQTGWIDLYLNPTRKRADQKISISLGRNYSLLPSSTILDIYEKAKVQQDNVIILDDLFQQYILARYKNDPVNHELAVLKSQVEPYLHFTLSQITMLGSDEVQKKIMFQDFWNQADIVNKNADKLKEEYKTWLSSNKVVIKLEQGQKQD